MTTEPGTPSSPSGFKGNAVQTLTGAWHLAPDPDNRGREERWFSAVRGDALPAPVPGIIQQVFPDYHGVAWYWHRFRPDRLPNAHGRSLLRFGAVDYLAEVWLNGTLVGGHEGGETPFTLDVAEALKPDDNLLAVRVLNPIEEPIDGIRLAETPHRNKRNRDYQPGASLNHGGIMLPIDLLTVPAVRIADVFARPDIATGEIRLTITIRNDEGAPAAGRLMASAGPASTGEVLDTASLDAEFIPGETLHELSLSIAQPRFWSLDDPHLYSVAVHLTASADNGAAMAHVHAIRCGFRDFRVLNGFFRLNGKRIFLRSTHTGNHFPIGQQLPPTSDMLRRDLIYAKASGFNMVRFIAGVAYPEQLDFCDEIGLMVYEESYAGWLLEDSPHMAERYDRSIREMVLRDRNHPSVTIWGLLNETPDGPVFRRAVEGLALVRSLDDTRLVLLNSGRWDCQWSIGSLSNPGSSAWEHQWGAEAPGAPAASSTWDRRHGGYFDRAGDAHVYPVTPHPPHTIKFLRTLGHDTKPVFLSEYGTGSLLDVIRGLRMFEQVRARPDLADAALFRSMADRLQADWERFGMEGTYPFPEDMLRDSQRLHVRQRALGFDLVRSNPRISGFNVTGMLDHGITGEGLWTFWREWKPGIADALADGWAPLRWCLFAEPLHGYTGRPVKLEAVLANEDVLPPGEYPVRFRVFGPAGVAWERSAALRIPSPAAGEDGPLAVPVLCEDVSISGPAGEYHFAAQLQRGGAPAGGRLAFRLSDPAELPSVKATVALWGVDERTESWLVSRGIRCRKFSGRARRRPEVILVGAPAETKRAAAAWSALAGRMACGSTVIFLSPLAFRQGEDPVRWLPLANKGRCYEFSDWLYHKECVAKAHPVFEGLQCRGIMDWDYYDQVIPHYLFDGQDTPDEVAAAAFAVGYSCPGGYASGVLVGSYAFGAGRFILNTLRILENLDLHPAADRLLLNLISHGQKTVGGSLADLPADFEERLRAIGYE
jgi:hypothetical protein